MAQSHKTPPPCQGRQHGEAHQPQHPPGALTPDATRQAVAAEDLPVEDDGLFSGWTCALKR